MVPYGEVSVDGEHVGSSPITLPLKPGKHAIVGRSGGRTIQRTVTLAAGEHRQLVLR